MICVQIPKNHTEPTSGSVLVTGCSCFEEQMWWNIFWQLKASSQLLHALLLKSLFLNMHLCVCVCAHSLWSFPKLKLFYKEVKLGLKSIHYFIIFATTLYLIFHITWILLTFQNVYLWIFWIHFASMFPSEKLYFFWLYHASFKIDFLKFKSKREDSPPPPPLGVSNLKSDLKLEKRDFTPWRVLWCI